MADQHQATWAGREAQPSPIDVYCYPVTANSNYVPLLFTGIGDRYRAVYLPNGSLDDLQRPVGPPPGILHVHWEEFVLEGCQNEAAACAAVLKFGLQLDRIKSRGFPIVWTVHNEVPHELGFLDQFIEIRRLVADAADIILMHNEISIGVVARQVNLDRSKVSVLRHPSYLDRFEDRDALLAGLQNEPDRRVQGFGWIRHQKGFGELITSLSADYLAARGISIRISGQGNDVARQIAARVRREDIEWDVRHVPDTELPDLLRTAACVVLPYERILTSGVALLAMSVGALPLMIDLPQLRELLPVTNHRFLFRKADGGDLRRAIDAVLSMSREERREAIEENLTAAINVHPRLIAHQLSVHYDRLILKISEP